MQINSIGIVMGSEVNQPIFADVQTPDGTFSYAFISLFDEATNTYGDPVSVIVDPDTSVNYASITWHVI